MASAEAYPLYWPLGSIRTRTRERGRFKVTFSYARDLLMQEMRRLGAKDVILSTNMRLRHDGLPYAPYKDPDDPGVAIYFSLKGKPHVMACDRWQRLAHNIQALAKTIEAMRGISRWGSLEAQEQAFRGFHALPPPPPGPAAPTSAWKKLFGFGPHENPALDTVRSVYKGLALRFHPDRPGGSTEAMKQLNFAMEEAERELGGGA